MTRIWHPWDLWEDYRHNFYGGAGSDSASLQDCANLLKDLPRFEQALKVIVNEWKYSCEHNLSNASINRIAYLGQASFALLFNIPQSKSMGAYSLLDRADQIAADALAQKYLDLWLERNKDVQS